MKVLTLLDSVHAIGIGQTWRHRVAFFMQSLLLLGLISHIRVAHHWKIPDIYIYMNIIRLVEGTSTGKLVSKFVLLFSFGRTQPTFLCLNHLFPINI